MLRKAISPLQELIWSTSSYLRWHGQAPPQDDQRFFFFFFKFSSTRQHTRINADFIIAEQLPAMVINAVLLVLSSLWRRLPLQTLQITVIHHGAALHRWQS